jgi:cell division protein FtsZ
MFTPPGLNFVWRNAIIHCERDLKGNPASYDRFANVVRGDDPGFLAGDDLKPRLDPALFMALGLRPILTPLQTPLRPGRRNTISSVIAGNNREVPAFMRFGAAATPAEGQAQSPRAALRAMGAPGEEDFLFEDDELDTPAYIRKNAD